MINNIWFYFEIKELIDFLHLEVWLYTNIIYTVFKLTY